MFESDSLALFFVLPQTVSIRSQSSMACSSTRKNGNSFVTELEVSSLSGLQGINKKKTYKNVEHTYLTKCTHINNNIHLVVEIIKMFYFFPCLTLIYFYRLKEIVKIILYN